jgi:acyl-CoA dehydrogenase
MEIDQARLMVLHAAWRMDTEGKRAARQDISMIKVIAAQMHQDVLDRAMQVHGALGMSDDTPLRPPGAGPLAADRRRARRGAQDGDRAA